MKKLTSFTDALSWQIEQEYYDVNNDWETGVVNIDRVQFSLGDVLWLAIADNYYLDDYEESVTQYGVTSSGKWAAVYGGHCSCYGWEEMEDRDITYYDTLEILVKADAEAVVILQNKDVLKEVLPFLNI